MTTPPPAPRRDHRDGERPRGARLRWQDGHCHKKPTRGAIQNLKMKTKLPYKTQRGAIRGKDWTLQCLISSLYNALVHHHVQYWICMYLSGYFPICKFPFDKAFWTKYFYLLTKHFYLLTTYLYISGYFSIREFPFDKVASSSPPWSLHHILWPRWFQVFTFSQTIIFLVTFFDMNFKIKLSWMKVDTLPLNIIWAKF